MKLDFGLVILLILEQGVGNHKLTMVSAILFLCSYPWNLKIYPKGNGLQNITTNFALNASARILGLWGVDSHH